MLNRVNLRLFKFLNAFVYFFIWLSNFLVLYTFFKVKVIGKENIPKYGRFILAGNHQNFIDGFFLCSSIGPFRRIIFVIAKRALKSVFFQLLAKLSGFVLIGNEIEEYQRAIKKLNRLLAHGEPVAIFPEGDISKNPIPKKFKGGVAKLSLDTQTKVIPIYLSGTYNLRNLSYWFKRSTITVKIGTPISLYNYADLCENSLEKIAALLREEIIALAEDGVRILHSEKKLNNSQLPTYNTSIKPTAAR